LANEPDELVVLDGSTFFVSDGRGDSRVRYPTASSPQAWAAAAPLLGLRTLLGLDAGASGLQCEPHVPARIGRLRVRGVQHRGERSDTP
jgi:glycogen debranching enzyme